MATKEEAKKNMKINAVCGIVCVSLIGGTIYCMNNPELIWKDMEKPAERIVDVSETTDAEFQKILDNMHVTLEEEKQVNNNIIDNIGKAISDTAGNVTSYFKDFGKVYLEGCDKNGNPYLKKGASYTFKADGSPVEAPPDGAYTQVQANGKTWCYSNFNHEWYDLAPVVEANHKAALQAKGLIDSQGNTNIRSLTEEEARELARRTTINVGSIGY